jgi:hypothetical protein
MIGLFSPNHLRTAVVDTFHEKAYSSPLADVGERARFSAFSLSFRADFQAIAMAFRLPVTPNPPFRSQSQSEASRRAAPLPVPVQQWFHRAL